jgi:hypothetical protein
MKFKLPAPIQIQIGETAVQYSLADMVAHFVRRGREFGRSEDDARAGKRILDAFASARGGEVELDPADAKKLREMARKPSCGWARHEVEFELPTNTPNGVTLRKVKKYGQGAAIDYLPLIDALPNV